MPDLSAQFDDWMKRHDGEEPATPAATVVVLRDAANGPEVLMVKRNSSGSFASMWVFPGGKVDAEDHVGGGGVIAASRRAAAREAVEEADLILDANSLVPLSHWMPPSTVPRRFSTWFFAAHAPTGTDGDVSVDEGEIVDHLWLGASSVLELHARGEVQLMPPTWVTLTHLSASDSAASAIEAVRQREPRFYVTKQIASDPPILAWHGDGDYESSPAAEPTSSQESWHRLVMDPDGWQFFEPAD